jgi:bla regulator protein blaR1
MKLRRLLVLQALLFVLCFSVGLRSFAQSAAPALAQSQESFDVASVRPIGTFNPSPVLGAGCDGGFPRVEQNRFVVTTTVYALITWAYGFNKEGGCSFVSIGNFLSGGPDWLRSNRFEVQALMPDGSPAYTTAQFLNGDAPALEIMIRNLLADRFKLALHHETKVGPVLALVPAKGGPKVTPSKEDGPSGLGISRDQTAQGSSRIIGRKTSMTYLALLLVLVTHQPVLDRTGLTGNFDFEVDYAPPDSGPDASAPSIFTALQEQLGLRLQSQTGPVDVLVVDHIEEPSPN